MTSVNIIITYLLLYDCVIVMTTVNIIITLNDNKSNNTNYLNTL